MQKICPAVGAFDKLETSPKFRNYCLPGNLMKYLKKYLLFIILLQSCSWHKSQTEELQAMLKECDEVVIVMDNYDNNSNTSFKIKDSSGINVFTELIKCKNEKIVDSCEPMGDLLYKKGGKVLFTAEFSIPNVQLNSHCVYVRYNLELDTFRHRLTYRSGIFLGQLKYGRINRSEIDTEEFPSQ